MAGQCVTVSFKPLLQPHDPEIDGTCVELPASLRNDDAGPHSYIYHSDTPITAHFLLNKNVTALLDSIKSYYKNMYSRPRRTIISDAAWLLLLT